VKEGLRQRRRRLLERLRGTPGAHFLEAEGLILGEGVYFGEGVRVDPAHCWLISIGSRTTIAPRVHILAHDASTRRTLGYTRIERVTIGEEVFIGANSLILPGVTIGDRAIIGAGSVVRHDVAPDTVAAGNPARPVRSTTDYLEAQRERLKTAPKFSRAWTTKEGITPEMRVEMRERIGDGAGFVK
jgi:maltose O-acetyltransferase